jgi:hypothetical protein
MPSSRHRPSGGVPGEQVMAELEQLRAKLELALGARKFRIG